MQAILLRDGKLFRRGLWAASALAVLLFMLCAAAGLTGSAGAGNLTQPVQVAVSAGNGGALNTLYIKTVSAQPVMQALIEVTVTDEQTALAGVQNGTYGAAVILPEDFATLALTGKSATGRIVLSESVSASAEVVSALARFGELMLMSGQFAVFAGEALPQVSADPSLHESFLETANPELISQALEFYDTAFVTETLPYTQTGLSRNAHYATVWLGALLTLCGLVFTRLFTADSDESLRLRLRAYGIGPGKFFFGKLLWPVLFRMALLFAAVIAANRLLSELLPLTLTAGSLLYATAAALLATAVPSGLALSGKKESRASGAVMLLTAAGIILCGGLFPRTCLPEFILILGDLTPLGGVSALLAPLFGGTLRLLPLCSGVIWAVVCCAAALWKIAGAGNIKPPRSLRRVPLPFILRRGLSCPAFLLFAAAVLLLPPLAARTAAEAEFPQAGFCVAETESQADVYSDGETSKLCETLKSLGFVEYESEAALGSAVESGELDGAIIVPGSISNAVISGETEGILTYLQSESSLFPELWRQEACAALFRVAAPHTAARALSAPGAEQAAEALPTVYEEMLADGAVFRFETETVSETAGEAADNAEASSGEEDETAAATEPKATVSETAAGAATPETETAAQNGRPERFFRWSMGMLLFCGAIFGIALPVISDTRTAAVRMPRKKAIRRVLIPSVLLRTAVFWLCLLCACATAEFTPFAGIFSGATSVATSGAVSGTAFGAGSFAYSEAVASWAFPALALLPRLTLCLVADMALSLLLATLIPESILTAATALITLLSAALCPVFFDLASVLPWAETLRMVLPTGWG